ncbi:MAG TPA: hypothetical protein VGB54_10505 [Allosphingosinicella sp.]|jgi:hypothetical protein
MNDRNVAGSGGTGRMAAKVVAGLLTVYSALGIAFTSLGVLLSLMRVIWYPSSNPLLVIAIYVLALALAIWAFRNGLKAFKSPEWRRIGLVAVAGVAFAALMILGREWGNARPVRPVRASLEAPVAAGPEPMAASMNRDAKSARPLA